MPKVVCNKAHVCPAMKCDKRYPHDWTEDCNSERCGIKGRKCIPISKKGKSKLKKHEPIDKRKKALKGLIRMAEGLLKQYPKDVALKLSLKQCVHLLEKTR